MKADTPSLRRRVVRVSGSAKGRAEYLSSVIPREFAMALGIRKGDQLLILLDAAQGRLVLRPLPLSPEEIESAH